jgi:hypothetical protein
MKQKEIIKSLDELKNIKKPYSIKGKALIHAKTKIFYIKEDILKLENWDGDWTTTQELVNIRIDSLQRELKMWEYIISKIDT